MKFPYFVDISERGDQGWKQAQRQGDFLYNSNICEFLSFFHILKKIMRTHYAFNTRGNTLY